MADYDPLQDTVKVIVVHNMKTYADGEERRLRYWCECDDLEEATVVEGIMSNTVYLSDCSICHNRHGEFI